MGGLADVAGDHRQRRLRCRPPSARPPLSLDGAGGTAPNGSSPRSRRPPDPAAEWSSTGAIGLDPPQISLPTPSAAIHTVIEATPPTLLPPKCRFAPVGVRHKPTLLWIPNTGDHSNRQDSALLGRPGSQSAPGTGRRSRQLGADMTPFDKAELSGIHTPSKATKQLRALARRNGLTMAYSLELYQACSVAMSGNSSRTILVGVQLPSRISWAPPRARQRPPNFLIVDDAFSLYSSYACGSWTSMSAIR